MASIMPFEEVMNTDYFKNASAEEKNSIKRDYFEEVVKPVTDPRDYNTYQHEFNKEFPDYTTGIGGAAESSFERLKGGAQYLMGDEEGAKKSLQESYRYEPTVRSYHDINNPMDLVNYVGEQVGSASPYLGGVILGPLTGGGSLAVDGIVAAAESSAIYQEQGEKNALGAIAAGFGGQVIGRIGGREAGINRLLTPVGTEAVKGGAQQMLTNMVGYGEDFDTATKNIDESMIGGAIQFTAAKAASRAMAKPVEMYRSKYPTMGGVLPTAEGEGWAQARQEDEARLSQARQETIENHQDVDIFSRDIDDIQTGRELENSVEAARKLHANGADLSSGAFDFDVTTRKLDKHGRPKKGNLAKMLGIGTVGEKVAQGIRSNIDLPFFGDYANKNPEKAYQNTKDAYGDLRSQFDENITDTVNQNVEDNERAKVLRGIHNYVDGKAKKLDTVTKLAVVSSDNLKLFDEIVQMKRMRQMTEAMKPKKAGKIGGIGIPGVEAIATGGAPIVSTTGAILGTGISKIMSSKDKKYIKSLLEGGELKSGEDLDKAIDHIAQAIETAGRATQDKQDLTLK